MVADVEHEGRVEGVHYWNVTPGGVELDLTQDQFIPGESLINRRRVSAERDSSSAGDAGDTLSQGVRRRSVTAPSTSTPTANPATTARSCHTSAVVVATARCSMASTA